MTAALSAVVVRSWSGLNGRRHAHVRIEKTGEKTTVSGAEPFAEGQRVSLEKINHEYRLIDGGG